MEKSIKWKDRFARLNVPIIFWGLLLLVVILGFVSPNSVKPAHLLDFTRQAAPMILVAIGQTIVMMIGGLDLSVAAVMVLIDVVAAQMMMNDPSRAVPVALLCLCIGMVVGLVNGFLCAAIGFALVDILNRSVRFSIQLSPLFLAITAFCFSMTIGVLWEFFECTMDQFFFLDMQKDTVVHAISSVMLDPAGGNHPTAIRNITDVIVVTADGTQRALGLGGYLDIGILDTMKDLFVNFIGAVVFSIIGYFYVKSRGKGRFARRFIPQVVRPEEEKTEE